MRLRGLALVLFFLVLGSCSCSADAGDLGLGSSYRRAETVDVRKAAVDSPVGCNVREEHRLFCSVREFGVGSFLCAALDLDGESLL